MYNYETLLGLGVLAGGISYLAWQLHDYYYVKKMLPVLCVVEQLFEGAPENSGTEYIARDFLNESDTKVRKILFAGERLAARQHLKNK